MAAQTVTRDFIFLGSGDGITGVSVYRSLSLSLSVSLSLCVCVLGK